MDFMAIVAIPIIIFKFIVGHIRLTLIGVALIAALIFIPKACHKTSTTAQPTISVEQTNGVDIRLAPYVLATPSRFYYVALYDIVSDSEISLTKWYEWDPVTKQWLVRNFPLDVTKQEYGDFRFYKR